MGFGDTKPQPVQLLAARYVFHKLGGVSGRSKKKEKGSQMDAREAFAATTPLGKGVIQALADLLQQPVVGGGRGHGEGGAQECVLVALEALTLLVCDEGANRYSQGNSLHLVQEEAALKVISRAEALMNMRVLVGGVSLARVAARLLCCISATTAAPSSTRRAPAAPAATAAAATSASSVAAQTAEEQKPTAPDAQAAKAMQPDALHLEPVWPRGRRLLDPHELARRRRLQGNEQRLAAAAARGGAPRAQTAQARGGSGLAAAPSEAALLLGDNYPHALTRALEILSLAPPPEAGAGEGGRAERGGGGRMVVRGAGAGAQELREPLVNASDRALGVGDGGGRSGARRILARRPASAHVTAGAGAGWGALEGVPEVGPVVDGYDPWAQDVSKGNPWQTKPGHAAGKAGQRGALSAGTGKGVASVSASFLLQENLRRRAVPATVPGGGHICRLCKDRKRTVQRRDAGPARACGPVTHRVVA